MPHSVIPPYLLEKIAAATDTQEAADAAARTLADIETWRPNARIPLQPNAVEPSAGLQRTISDAKTAHTVGDVVRTEGQPEISDVAVNEAYDGLGATYKLYNEVYQRDSIDGKGLPLLATVHYGKKYSNAFWDGARMTFGDGDATYFNRFTISLSIIGHELTHGVTQYSANLAYQNQSGALNESVSDVFGALVEQYLAGHTAENANWLIGAGIFTPKVTGTAIRSMKAPGTAYNDPRLGKDPQPATMAGYVTTRDDNGGVHINSGIPNHAFYLVATALGGHAWERAGRIWYHTLTGKLAPTTDFRAFATATKTAATTLYGDTSPELDAVERAWRAVGVI